MLAFLQAPRWDIISERCHFVLIPDKKTNHAAVAVLTGMVLLAEWPKTHSCTLLSKVQHRCRFFEKKGISSELAAAFGRTAEESNGGAFSTWTTVSTEKHPR